MMFRALLAAITLVGSTSGVSGGGFFSTTANTFTSTPGQNLTGANFIWVALSEANITTCVVTDSSANSYTPLTIQTANSKSSRVVYAWNAAVSSSQTWTVTCTAGFPAMTIAWFAGVQATSDPFDVQNGAANGNTTSLATNSVTPTNNGSLVVTQFQSDAIATPPTITAPFSPILGAITDTGFGHQLSAQAYEIQTTATARNPTWTRSATQTITVNIAVFNAAAGAGGCSGWWCWGTYGENQRHNKRQANPFAALSLATMMRPPTFAELFQ